MKYHRIVIIMSVLIVVVHSFFLTPNFDEGLNAYFITNTIDFEKPFFICASGRTIWDFMPIMFIFVI